MMILSASLLFAAVIGAIRTGKKQPALEKGPSLNGATGWLNSQPLRLEDLRGKVVLIDFWTYTCINWRRTLPYIREWASKYKEQGLVVIGVHTPEFLFEYEFKNVSRAIGEMNIGYPVALDNDYTIWNSFHNNYWPALYLIDAKGKVRYQKFGEGDYAESEQQLQQLLKEASATTVSGEISDPDLRGYEAAADWKQLLSSENFLGYNRTEGFVSPQGIISDRQKLYSLPVNLKLNRWALSGTWIMGKENLRSTNVYGKIIYRFHARDLHLIMGTARPGTSVQFRVLVDGKTPGDAHGLDIDDKGNGTVTDQRMYQLIRQQGTVADREFQIEFLDPGVEVFDFTFG